MHVQVSSAHRLILIATVLSLSGCGTEDVRSASAPLALSTEASPAEAAATDGARRVELPFDPENFVRGVQNPYFPLVPGTVYSYVQETPDGQETNEVEVTHQQKLILGVRTFVVHDRVFLEGSLKEDTFDWYVPDKYGNVWYFGEDTKEVENGVPVSTLGSWEAGKNGAKAGIIMLANPTVGDTYFQENAPGVVADQARIMSLNETVTVPYATFTSCVKTEDWTPLEPGNRAFKLYAPGIGLVLEIPNHGGGHVELTDVSGHRGGPGANRRNR